MPEPIKSKGPRPSSHGLHLMKQSLRVLGNRGLDQRTKISKAIRTWQADLIQDLGGPEAISVQQRAIVDLAVKTKLMLDSIDVWLLNQKSLINQTKRAVFPVVLQRQTLANALADYMGKLGLEKKAKPLVPLNEYIQTRYGPNLERKIAHQAQRQRRQPETGLFVPKGKADRQPDPATETQDENAKDC